MTSFLRRVASAACLCVAASAAFGFDLQGHRGARGLAPENTLAAFKTALAIGVTTLELDVGLTKDGVLVVHHDRWLGGTTARGPDGSFLSGRGPLIRALTLSELRGYDVGRLNPQAPYAASFPTQRPADGERVPTLAEVFALARNGGEHVRFNVETTLSPNAPADTVDPDTFARALARAVRESGLASRVAVQSFDWRTLSAMARIAPEISRVCLTSQGKNFDTVGHGKPGPSPWTGLDIAAHGNSTPRLVATAGCATWSPAFRDLDAERLAEAKALGLQVIPWTVNETADIERLMALGVDGLITDYPDRARAVMAAKGMALPPQVAPAP
jgi:glycerophosphoryl diester phosphodiesterase